MVDREGCRRKDRVLVGGVGCRVEEMVSRLEGDRVESDGWGDAGKVVGSSLASPVATSRFHTGKQTEVLTISQIVSATLSCMNMPGSQWPVPDGSLMQLPL